MDEEGLDLDEIVMKTNPYGCEYEVRFWDTFKYARIHLGIPPYDKNDIKIINLYNKIIF